MFIALEGPDEVGKTTSATNLSYDGTHHYNVTKTMHQTMQQGIHLEKDLVVVYDRIDWLTHMVYRLAMPEKDWNDDRSRTVFAMPDTHLVLKMHHPQYAEMIDAPDEGYALGKVARVNQMYFYQIEFLMNLNRIRGYELFKTVSIMEVINNQKNGTFSQRLMAFDSPAFEFGSVAERFVDSDEALLDLLRYEESQHI